MTMSIRSPPATKKHRLVPAGVFKATCLALLDEVAQSGQVLVITKHGRPVAKLSPVVEVIPKPLLGSVILKGDLVAPIDVSWDVDP